MFASGQLRFAASWLALVVAACAGPIATNPVGTEVPPAAIATVTPPAPSAPVVEPVLEPPVPAPPAPPLPPPLPPRNDTELRAVFGAPNFVRREAESELWRYDGAACTLFVFLYRVSETVLIRHMETLPSNADMTADEVCLASIRARKAG